MPPEAPDYLPAPAFDCAVSGMAETFVSMIHLCLEFEERLDPDRLARAVRLLVDAEPVLGCRFEARFFKPRWRRLEAGELDRLPFIRTVLVGETGIASETADFLTETFDPGIDPPIRICLLTGPSRDRLHIKVDHQVTDAAGLKYLGYRLAEIYRALETDPAFQPEINTSPRGQDEIFRPFLPGRIPTLFKDYLQDLARVSIPSVSLTFPVEGVDGGRLVFTERHFGPERSSLIRDYASRRGATVNDLVNAVMVRALIETAPWDGKAAIKLIGTVDLRRYLPSREADAVCNRSGWYFLTLGSDPGTDPETTLDRVRSRLSALKENRIGLGLSLFSYLLMSPLPSGLRVPLMRSAAKSMIRQGSMPPILTNMGAIDPNRLDFGSARPASAFLLVPPGAAPNRAMGLSSFRNALTLSAGYPDSPMNRDRIEALFNRFESLLPG
ncbi:MAG: hypothetical protein KKB20_13960 [Proteobacteria bacterium]|nr:hypothetical protein [Pseudomonadota bacterium]